MNLVRKLVEEGLITEKKGASVEYEVQSSSKKVEEVILEKNLVPEQKLFELKSKVLEIPLAEVYAEDVSERALKLLPRESAEQYWMVPLGEKGGDLVVGMVYPQDMGARDALKFIARQHNLSYEVQLVTPSTFKEIFRKYRGLKKEVSKALGEMEEEAPAPSREGEAETGEWKRLAEETPVSKVVDVLLRHALEGGASDVHIEPFGDKLRVRFRVLGELHSSIFLPIDYLSKVVARVKILADLRLDESRVPQDGRFSKEVEGRKIDFRVSTFPTGKGEKVAIRILDPKEGLKPFAQLGLSERNLKILKDSIATRGGMVLVSGPTGSGKTTTLYALLRHLNREGVNVVTLEDPIEYFMEGISQSQIKPDLGYDFAQGLRYVVRQDPDIIMVGEIRDAESAQLSVHAALTGHLFFSTLHAPDVFGIVPRLARLSVESYLIPIVLECAVAQRLVRRLCDNCKERVEAGEKVRGPLLREIEKMPEPIREEVNFEQESFVFEPRGCKECDHTGFSDRIGVFEVLKMTESLGKMIVEGRMEKPDIREEARKQELVTMRQDAVLKALKGLTTVEEAFHVAVTD